MNTTDNGNNDPNATADHDSNIIINNNNNNNQEDTKTTTANAANGGGGGDTGGGGGGGPIRNLRVRGQRLVSIFLQFLFIIPFQSDRHCDCITRGSLPLLSIILHFFVYIDTFSV
jgi:hypothetical protein